MQTKNKGAFKIFREAKAFKGGQKSFWGKAPPVAEGQKTL